MSREDHWYIPGKLPHEKQHIWEHKTLQVLAQMLIMEIGLNLKSCYQNLIKTNKEHYVKCLLEHHMEYQERGK